MKNITASATCRARKNLPAKVCAAQHRFVGARKENPHRRTGERENDGWKAKQTAFVLDLDGKAGQSYGAKHAHMFVLTPGARSFEGAIDSKATPNPSDIANRPTMKVALEESLPARRHDCKHEAARLLGSISDGIERLDAPQNHHRRRHTSNIAIFITRPGTTIGFAPDPPSPARTTSSTGMSMKPGPSLSGFPMGLARRR